MQNEPKESVGGVPCSGSSVLPLAENEPLDVTVAVKGNLLHHFAQIPDYRVDRRKRHELLDILVIAICGVLSGADDWVSIALYGQSRIDWLKTFLKLPNGIPSHDTFGRVFALLEPQKLQDVFAAWVLSLRETVAEGIVALDGKTMRRAFEKGKNKGVVHMVSAWSTANHLVLGQRKVDAKSNEIKAIPALLDTLDIRGATVTIDAMGCQKEIANQIVNQGGDYILALKGNQGALHDDVKLFFADAAQTGYGVAAPLTCETVEKDHGRIETRRCTVVQDIAWLAQKKDWKKLVV